MVTSAESGEGEETTGPPTRAAAGREKGGWREPHARLLRRAYDSPTAMAARQIVRWTLRWVVPVLLGVILLAAWTAGLVGAPRADGYFSPVFSPDGTSVFA